MMYKVFLVDDEIVIREGIRSSFPWDSSSFVLAGEAPDGEIALSLMQEIKPDILITDIRMPFMDGLTLCRKALALMPWLKIIILSGFDEFTYAREALVLGVREYLLKPINAQELEEALRRIAAQIDEERRQFADLQAVKRQLELSSGLMKEQFLKELLQGIKEEEKRASVFPDARKLGLNIMARHYRVMLIAPREGTPVDPLLPRGLISRTAASQPEGSVYHCQMNGFMALLFLGESLENMEEQVFSFAEAVKHEAGDLKLPTMHIAIGSPVGAVFALPDSFASALITLKAMQEHLGDSRTSIMDSGDTQAGLGELLSLAKDASLFDRLRFAPISQVEEIVSDMLNKDGVVQRSLIMLNYVLVESVLTATRIIKEQGGDPGALLPAQLRDEGGLSLLTQPEDILKAAREALTRALEFRDRQNLSRYNEVIRQACAFIENNYTNPHITLGDAAEAVHLSPNHFCTVFSQETGSTFIEYLTRLRLERARELLEGSQARSSSIAHQVGYRDPHYFSYLFKKHTGLSPRDWRKQRLAGEA
ncbi:MAG: response regulator [Clostridiales bacterium]|nr:response regulator [Clostridiales bacterium]